MDDIGDIAVNEDVARFETKKGGLRASRIRAANPEDLRVLADRECGEERRVLLGNLRCPILVLMQSRGEAI